jgi:8-oxo-dGTP pyrophosphatase MutT (NUDIX family)
MPTSRNNFGPRPNAVASGAADESLLSRLRISLGARALGQGPRGDHDLNPDMSRSQSLVPAAVLIPIVAGAEPQVLFTKRAPDLADHAGEISFPGGRIEAGDADAVAAALRETEEELGLPRSGFEVLGQIDPYETRTGFKVAPVVGLIQPPLVVRPDPREVAEVFEVPLAYILDRANHRRDEYEAGGALRRFYAIPFGDHVIWGATAGIIMDLCDWIEGR